MLNSYEISTTNEASAKAGWMRSLALVAVLSTLMCVPWLERPFHTRGEPREALVAQAMLDTGNWVSPPAYDGAVPSKPPFSHWLISIMSLPRNAVTEATARLPSALAYISFMIGFFVFASRRLTTQRALVSSLILLSASEWFRAASTCRVDTILATSMAGALISLFAWWERGFSRVPLLAIILTTCATLTKGPVGFVLPLGIFSLFCWSRAEFRVRALFAIAMRAVLILLPVIALTGIWYLLGYLERGDDFFQKIMYENVQRFAGTMADEPHKHSVFYLFGVLALGLLPWTVLIVVEWIAIARRSRGSITPGARHIQRSREQWRAMPALIQYSWIAAVSILVFFCIPSSKRSVYLLPAYPFIALLLEGALVKQTLARPRSLARVLSQVVYVITGLALCASIILYGFSVGGLRLSSALLLESFTPLKVISLAVLGVALLVLYRKDSQLFTSTHITRLALSVVVALVMLSCFIYDTVAWQLSPKAWVNSREFQKVVAATSRSTLYSFGSESYGASFYLHTPFSRIVPGARSQEGSVVFLEARKLDEFKRQVTPHIRELFRYRSEIESNKKDIVVIQLVSGQPVDGLRPHG